MLASKCYVPHPGKGSRGRTMIVGVGVDLIEMSRVAAAISGSGERFLERLFTPFERADCKGRRDEVALLAERFAAKEALLR